MSRYGMDAVLAELSDHQKRNLFIKLALCANKASTRKREAFWLQKALQFTK